MTSELVKGLLSEFGARVVVSRVSNVVLHAQDSHDLLPGSSLMLAQGLTAGSLLAALQKENQPINLQLECDGPLRGMFVEALPDGKLRGYVKNPYVEFEGDVGAYRYRPILGNKGYLSVLRDIGGGEFYRSSVELMHFDMSKDLQVFFNQSEQAQTRIHMHVEPVEGENHVRVVGVLVQVLPQGNSAYVEQWGTTGDTRAFLEGHMGPWPSRAEDIAKSLFGAANLTLTETVPLSYSCRCSREKMMDALRLLGEEDLRKILLEDGRSEARCQFCGKKYIANTGDLQTLLEMLRAQSKN